MSPISLRICKLDWLIDWWRRHGWLLAWAKFPSFKSTESSKPQPEGKTRVKLSRFARKSVSADDSSKSNMCAFIRVFSEDRSLRNSTQNAKLFNWMFRMFRHTSLEVTVLIVMFVTAVCVRFLIQLRFRSIFKNVFVPKLNLSNQRMFSISAFIRGKCRKWTCRFPAFV